MINLSNEYAENKNISHHGNNFYQKYIHNPETEKDKEEENNIHKQHMPTNSNKYFYVNLT
jgi:hypothetical protein